MNYNLYETHSHHINVTYTYIMNSKTIHHHAFNYAYAYPVKTCTYNSSNNTEHATNQMIYNIKIIPYIYTHVFICTPNSICYKYNISNTMLHVKTGKTYHIKHIANKCTARYIHIFINKSKIGNALYFSLPG